MAALGCAPVSGSHRAADVERSVILFRHFPNAAVLVYGYVYKQAFRYLRGVFELRSRVQTSTWIFMELRPMSTRSQ